MTRKTRTPKIIALAALYSFVLLASSLLCPISAKAQTYTIPQTVTQTLASGLACTGSPQVFPLTNLGQTEHYASVSSTGTATMVMEIDGIDSSGNVSRISDTAMIGQNFAGTNPLLTATGYFPTVQIVLTCSPTSATFTLNYTGTSQTSNIIAGGYQLAQVDKVVSAKAGNSAALTYAVNFQTPFSDSLGEMFFRYSANGPSGSFIEVVCAGAVANTPTATYEYALASGSSLQSFIIPDSTCPSAEVQYISGGASAAKYSLEYLFVQGGFKLSSTYTHLATTNATIVKPGAGVVQSVAINTAASGTITLFDLPPASCSGSPSTNIVSIIDGSNATPRNYGALFVNGICVQASSGSIDFTVISQ